MIKMKRLLFFSFLLCVLSCNREEYRFLGFNNEDVSLYTKSQINHLIPEIQLVNPYKLEIMQHAADSMYQLGLLQEPLQLTTTHRYIRFDLRDSIDYKALINNGIELFDYPLDSLITNDYFMPFDTLYNTVQMRPQYASVPVGISIPNVPYILLDNCFIPEDSLVPRGEGRLANNVSGYMELLACHIANPDLPETSGLIPYYNRDWNTLGAMPSGRFTVATDDENINAPLKGVKVKVNSFVKTASTYTDDEGYYSINTSFVLNPWYSTEYINSKGFKVYGNWGTAAPATHGYSWRPNSGFTHNISKSERSWFWAVVNNAVFDYYETCENDGRVRPPYNLQVLCTIIGKGSSAPMLYHVGYQNISDYTVNELARLFFDTISASVTNAIVGMLRYLLPDITIKNNDSYDKLRASVYHELCHASHFSQTGQAQWNTYIGYIIDNWGYGDGRANNNGSKLCELSESFAYACERYYEPQWLFGENQWFLPGIKAILLLLKENVLTEQQILSCMTTSVGSIDQLYSALVSAYSSKSTQIKICFASNAALAQQTQWLVINNTGVKITFSASHTGLNRIETIEPGGSFALAAAPIIISSFDQIKTTYSSYYPNHFEMRQYLWPLPSIRVYEEVPTYVFYQLPSREFFDGTQWSLSTEYRNVGGKFVLHYDFLLLPTDL